MCVSVPVPMCLCLSLCVCLRLGCVCVFVCVPVCVCVWYAQAHTQHKTHVYVAQVAKICNVSLMDACAALSSLSARDQEAYTGFS
jgi:hypothetical protein